MPIFCVGGSYAPWSFALRPARTAVLVIERTIDSGVWGCMLAVPGPDKSQEAFRQFSAFEKRERLMPITLAMIPCHYSAYRMPMTLHEVDFTNGLLVDRVVPKAELFHGHHGSSSFRACFVDCGMGAKEM